VKLFTSVLSIALLYGCVVHPRQSTAWLEEVHSCVRSAKIELGERWTGLLGKMLSESKIWDIRHIETTTQNVVSIGPGNPYPDDDRIYCRLEDGEMRVLQVRYGGKATVKSFLSSSVNPRATGRRVGEPNKQKFLEFWDRAKSKMRARSSNRAGSEVQQ